MAAKTNPAPLVVSGNRAGIRYAQQLSSTRKAPEEQIRRHWVERIHRLGARVLAELLDEIGRHHAIEADIARRVERYAGLDPEILAVVGGDRFLARPMRVVGGAA
ncbi:MAG TPA: hypothetical protein VFC56_02760 [Stellaceae bacterium]|nr:hypothetical protein [Stellaceae bacterium]